ncbi:beta-propeller fold lactonase family protein, partial [Klebsiella pneumoniae]|uniref:beta-propeller fold lactonase family protein n=1 Tax=Klebsiella pneumoniae TaxID=573 RepID=UPI00272F7550
AHVTELADGTLTHQEQIRTRGDYPRTRTQQKQGQWLYDINQSSEKITRFSEAPKDAKITYASHYTPLGSPTQKVKSAQP